MYIQYNIAYTHNPLICITCNFILPGQHGAIHILKLTFMSTEVQLSPHPHPNTQYTKKRLFTTEGDHPRKWRYSWHLSSPAAETRDRQWQPQVDTMAWKEETNYRQLVMADRRLFGLQQGEVPNWLSNTKWSLESYTPAMLRGLSRWYLYLHEYM